MNEQQSNAGQGTTDSPPTNTGRYLISRAEVAVFVGVFLEEDDLQSITITPAAQGKLVVEVVYEGSFAGRVTSFPNTSETTR